MLDDARRELKRKFPEGEQITTDIAIDPRYVNLVSNFARKTGLGYNKEIRYDPPKSSPPYSRSDTSHSELDEDPDFGSQFGDLE